MEILVKTMILKTKKLKENVTFIKPVNFDSFSNNEIVETVRNYLLSDSSYQNIILDLTGMNFLCSVRIGSLIATYHFIEFVYGKIYIIVDDLQAKDLIHVMALDNVVIVYNKNPVNIANIA